MKHIFPFYTHSSYTNNFDFSLDRVLPFLSATAPPTFDITSFTPLVSPHTPISNNSSSCLHRATKSSSYLHDYHFSIFFFLFVPHLILSHVLGYDKLTLSHRALVCVIFFHVETATFSQATAIPE